ncbi:MAG TPA: hypothetical protein VMV32_02010 [Ignavibacteriaceae bacterium]|nr:hypothetical protein [Ignavibacteriaceae bacterium]
MPNEKGSSALYDEDVIKNRNNSKGKDNGLVGGIYGMAFIGAAIYFIQHATTFWLGVLGLIKSLLWPAVLVYKLLEFLKA